MALTGLIAKISVTCRSMEAMTKASTVVIPNHSTEVAVEWSSGFVTLFWSIGFGLYASLLSSSLLFSSLIPTTLGVATMIFFVKEYLLALFGLLATLISGFLPPWVKRLAAH